VKAFKIWTLSPRTEVGIQGLRFEHSGCMVKRIVTLEMYLYFEVISKVRVMSNLIFVVSV
jgi:hypothetical protein